ncbi:Oidioi.mRNA.OKI2018_I69.PAR.g9557.t1.cds [Oikopleura dioica]|uniref:Oidioi.mRNA.OKI2018_I69.PAR.g9557.t1.cds n=1 Tax=Oikopleura dioica TaxID=34765 RepID=A0ABN7RS30_OIKDI|nr:Oidioi.mRNA.OKI2018_I69.PAR.g9557.t1.cds [Oikopleura dioica]
MTSLSQIDHALLGLQKFIKVSIKQNSRLKRSHFSKEPHIGGPKTVTNFGLRSPSLQSARKSQSDRSTIQWACQITSQHNEKSGKMHLFLLQNRFCINNIKCC